MAMLASQGKKVNRKDTVSIQTRFAQKRLASRTGPALVARFIHKLGLERIIDQQVRLQRGRNALYPVGMIFKAIVMGLIGGCRHLSHLAEIQNDPLIAKLNSWRRFPAVSTITRVLERFTFSQCLDLDRAESVLRHKVWKHEWFARVNLDLDSSAKSAFGHQEGVEWGHNTERSGKKRLNPIFAFIAQTGECLHSWLRPGDTFSANGSVEFLKECLAKLPNRAWSVVVRFVFAFSFYVDARPEDRWQTPQISEGTPLREGRKNKVVKRANQVVPAWTYRTLRFMEPTEPAGPAESRCPLDTSNLVLAPTVVSRHWRRLPDDRMVLVEPYASHRWRRPDELGEKIKL